MEPGDDYLDPYYDVIVLGTGLSESVVAAALAKAGRSVLHLDKNPYYGGDSCSFSFEQLLEWAESVKNGRGGTPHRPPAPSTETALAAVAKARAWKAWKDVQDQQEKLLEEEKSAAAAAAAASAAEDASIVTELGSGRSAGPAELHGNLPDDVAESRDSELVASSSNGESSNSTSEVVISTNSADGVSSGSGPETTEGPSTAAIDQELQKLRDLSVVPLSSSSSSGKVAITAQSSLCQRDKQPLSAAVVPARELEAPLQAAIPLSDKLDAAAAEQPSGDGDSAASSSLAADEGYVTVDGAPPQTQEGEEQGGKAAQNAVTPEIAPSPPQQTAEPAWAELLRRSRSINVDICPQMVVATGPAVDVLLASGVSRYLDFKTIEAVCIAQDQYKSTTATAPAAAADGAGSSYSGNSSGKPADQNATAGASEGPVNASLTLGAAAAPTVTSCTAAPLHIWRVPCSKGDVFGSRALSVLEKRVLMRLLQFCRDWGTRRQDGASDVLGRNELFPLGAGRSLERPQNKSDATAGDPWDANRFETEKRPFEDFLAHAKLPPRLRMLVEHALAMLSPLPKPSDQQFTGFTIANKPPSDAGPTETAAATALEERGNECTESSSRAARDLLLNSAAADTGAGLRAVWRHLSSLGRFGETAFLAPVYGSGEFSQAFCRMAAVYGAVYILRRTISAILLAPESSDEVEGNADGYAAKRRRCVGVVDEEGRVIGCGALVTSDDYFNVLDELSAGTGEAALGQKAGENALFALRRVSIVRGSTLPGLSRGAAVLPPGLSCVGNQAAIHALQLDDGVGATPGGSGLFLLHLSTTAILPVNQVAEGTAVWAPPAGGSSGAACTGKGDTPAAAAVSASASCAAAVGPTAAAAVSAATTSTAAASAAPADCADDAETSSDINQEDVLGLAAARLIASANDSTPSQEGETPEEIWSVSWRQKLPPAAAWRRFVDGDAGRVEPPPPLGPQSCSFSNPNASEPSLSLPSNVVLSRRLPPEAYLHGAVIQAASLYRQLQNVTVGLGNGPWFEQPANANAPLEEDDDEGDDRLMAAAAAAANEAAAAAAAAAAAVDLPVDSADFGSSASGECLEAAVASEVVEAAAPAAAGSTAAAGGEDLAD